MRIWPTTDLHRRAAALTVVIGFMTWGNAPGQLVINEFLFRDEDPRLEFIEVLNRSNAPVDLRNFGVADNRRVRASLAETPILVLPGSFAVFVRDTAAFDARFRSPRIRPEQWSTLNNGGDKILLYALDQVIDSVSFDASWGSVGVSMERVNPNGPASTKSNWRASVDATGATPGKRNSVFEVDRTPPALIEAEEWIDGTVTLYLSEPLASRALEEAVIRFGSGDRPRGVRLSNDASQIVLEPWSGADLSTVIVEGLSDASGNVAATLKRDVARQPGAEDLVINEILFEPATDPYDGRPDQTEFVEIRSTTTRPIALRGLYLTGRVTETGSADTLRAETPLRIRSEGFGLFVASGSRPQSFEMAYPSAPPESVTARISIDRQSLGLNNSNDVIRLHAANGLELDRVDYDRSWHMAERPDTRGYSLERISTAGNSNDAANWTSSVDPEGGTPGRENSVVVRPEAKTRRIAVSPSPFSPNGDGMDDFALIEVQTGRPASSAAVWIFDTAGRLVRRVANGAAVGPQAAFVWDGRDDASSPLPTGIYIAYVESVDTAAGDVQTFKIPVVIYQGR